MAAGFVACKHSLATVLKFELIEGDRGVPGSAVTDRSIEDDEELPHAGGSNALPGIVLRHLQALHTKPEPGREDHRVGRSNALYIKPSASDERRPP